MGTTIFSNIKATDIDAGVNGAVEYFIIEGDFMYNTDSNDTISTADGYGTFAISYPHLGHVSSFDLDGILSWGCSSIMSVRMLGFQLTKLTEGIWIFSLVFNPP